MRALEEHFKRRGAGSCGCKETGDVRITSWPANNTNSITARDTLCLHPPELNIYLTSSHSRPVMTATHSDISDFFLVFFYYFSLSLKRSNSHRGKWCKIYNVEMCLVTFAVSCLSSLSTIKKWMAESRTTIRSILSVKLHFVCFRSLLHSLLIWSIFLFAAPQQFQSVFQLMSVCVNHLLAKFVSLAFFSFSFFLFFCSAVKCSLWYDLC